MLKETVVCKMEGFITRFKELENKLDRSIVDMFQAIQLLLKNTMHASTSGERSRGVWFHRRENYSQRCRNTGLAIITSFAIKLHKPYEIRKMNLPSLCNELISYSKNQSTQTSRPTHMWPGWLYPHPRSPYSLMPKSSITQSYQHR